MSARQEPIRGTGTAAGFNVFTPLAGRTLTEGTYLFRLQCNDASTILFTYRVASHTGACTAEVFTPFVDGVTPNAAAAATNSGEGAKNVVTDGLLSEFEIECSGEAYKVFRVIVPAGGSLTLDIAEYRVITVASVTGGGGGGGGGAVTVADGADVTQGALADAAVTGDTAGSLSAKLRGLSKMFADVYVSASHWLKVQLQAGDLHIGQVGGNSVSLAPTITVSTTPAYAIDDVIGGKITLTGAVRAGVLSGILQSVCLTDHANQKSAMELIIFDSDPSSSTLTDNSRIVIHDSDIGKIIRRISISGSDWISFGATARAIADIGSIGKLVVASGSTSLYAALVSQGTPTFANTADLTMRAGILQD